MLQSAGKASELYGQEDGPVKLPIAAFSVLVLCLVSIPAQGQTVYSNGPINGTTDA